VSGNLDLVRSIYADWERGDYGRIDWAHPEVELVLVDGPDPGRWRGIVETGDRWRSYLDGWEDLRSTPVEYRTVDSERVLVLAHNSGVARASGIDIGVMGDVASVFHVLDGKVTKIVLYFDRDRALADLGLEE